VSRSRHALDCRNVLVEIDIMVSYITVSAPTYTHDNMPIDYKNVKIYAIKSPSHPEQLPYIGATAHTLTHRLSALKTEYKRVMSGKQNGGSMSKLVLQYDDAEIQLLGARPCADKKEMHRIRAIWIRRHPCCNNRIPGRTHAEYVKENKKKIQAKRSEQIRCRCGTGITRAHISDHRKTAKHIRLISKGHAAPMTPAC